MLYEQIVLSLTGFSAGLVVAAGVFSFLAVIGVFSRLIGSTGTANHIMLCETMMILGGTAGNLIDLYLFPSALNGNPDYGMYRQMEAVAGSEPAAAWLAAAVLAGFGLSIGIFAGCLVMSLAETLKAIPVLNRRIKLASVLPYMVFGMGCGKCLGALIYFFKDFGGT